MRSLWGIGRALARSRRCSAPRAAVARRSLSRGSLRGVHSRTITKSNKFTAAVTRRTGVPGIHIPKDSGFETFAEAQRDSLGIIIDDDCFLVPDFDVSNITFADGVHWYKTPSGEAVVLAHMCSTLEWCLPSPPPQHNYEETPVVYEATTDPDWYSERDEILRNAELTHAAGETSTVENQPQDKEQTK